MSNERLNRLAEIRRRPRLKKSVTENIMGWKRELIGSGVEYWFPLKTFGAIKTHSPEMTGKMDQLFGAKSEYYRETYQYVMNSEALQIGQGKVKIIGGFAPTGNVHLGSYQHLSAGRDIVSPKDILISFNDIEARTIRNTPDKEITAAIENFMKVIDWPVEIECRSQVAELNSLFERFKSDPRGKELVNQICGRELSESEFNVYNIRAAAYLRHQIKDISANTLESNNQTIIAFDGIEELSQLVYINELANLYNLPGIVAFISSQVPGFMGSGADRFKQGKSTPDDSLFASSKLGDILRRISMVHYSEPAVGEPLTPEVVKQKRIARNLLDSIISLLPPSNSLSVSMRLKRDEGARIVFINKFKNLSLEEIYTLVKTLRFGIPFSVMDKIKSQPVMAGEDLFRNLPIQEFLLSLYGGPLTNSAIEIIAQFLFVELQNQTAGNYAQTIDISKEKIELLKRRLNFEKKLEKNTFTKKTDLTSKEESSLEELAIQLGYRDVQIVNPEDDPYFLLFKRYNAENNPLVFFPRIKLALEALEVCAAKSVIENHLLGKFRLDHSNILERAISELASLDSDFDNEEIRKLVEGMTAQLFQRIAENILTAAGDRDRAASSQILTYENDFPLNHGIGINLGALGRNIELFSKKLGGPEKIIFTVKSSGYGGGYEIAKKAYDLGIRKFAVDDMENAATLKKYLNSEDVEILCLYPNSVTELVQAIDEGIALTVSDIDTARQINRYSEIRNKRTRIHLYVDTGLHRFGFNPDEVVGVVEELKKLENIDLEGVYTHFANADHPDKIETVNAQISKFEKIITELAAKGVDLKYIHLANSAAVANIPKATDQDFWRRLMPNVELLSRPGMSIYGMSDSPGANGKIKTEGIVTIQSRVMGVNSLRPGEPFGYGYVTTAKKKMTVAWIVFGYDKGMPRSVGNSGQLLINGEPANVATATMNYLPIILPENADIIPGDWITVVGPGGVSLDELAKQAGTIAQEILLNFTGRAAKINYFSK